MTHNKNKAQQHSVHKSGDNISPGTKLIGMRHVNMYSIHKSMFMRHLLLKDINTERRKLVDKMNVLECNNKIV